MKKKYICLLLAVVMLMGIFAGCVSTTPAASDSTTAPGNTPSESTAAEIVKQAPVLQAQVDAGTLPDLADRIPVESDVYVEADNNPTETPSYGGTLRTNNGGKWYFGPITEEPLFRLLDDGTVEPNVAKGYEMSDDGLVYTIHLREGMKWSDGEPFTAEDCVYYYNYILVTNVDNETGFIFYKSQDEGSGQFSYFAFSPDSMDTTYHLEFRYAQEESDLQSWFEGNFAYWNAAAIAADYDQPTMENVINLFAQENLAGQE